MSVFPYPFADGAWHTIGKLRAWEALLLEERKADEDFSSDVLRAKGAHCSEKSRRNKELAPLDLFAMHKNVRDDALFRVMPEGHSTDVELRVNVETLKLQFTVAFPCWIEGESQGHQSALKNEALELLGGVPSAAHFYRSKGGQRVEYEGGYVTDKERLRACRQGLEMAIKKKAKFAGNGLTLVVYAQLYRPHITSPREFVNNARLAIEKVNFPPFDRVCFLENGDGWFAEFLPSDFLPDGSYM